MKGNKKGLKSSTVVGYRDYDKKQKLHTSNDLLHSSNDLLHTSNDLLCYTD